MASRRLRSLLGRNAAVASANRRLAELTLILCGRRAGILLHHRTFLAWGGDGEEEASSNFHGSTSNKSLYKSILCWVTTSNLRKSYTKDPRLVIDAWVSIG
jgi:hypothetical protein